LTRKNYKVVRGIKPNVFEIYEDDKLISQDPSVRDYQKVLELSILKFNYRAFTQVIAIGGGTGYTPFMSMPAKDRREFVEDLLDLRSFSVMNQLIKDQSKITKDELKEVVSSIKSLKKRFYCKSRLLKS